MAFHRPRQAPECLNGPVEFETVIPNPKLKLLDLLREVMPTEF